MGEAIETTQQLYPNLLERNPNLFFTLKVRQFIEMVNGTDSEVRCLGGRSPKSQDSYSGRSEKCHVYISLFCLSVPQLRATGGHRVHGTHVHAHARPLARDLKGTCKYAHLRSRAIVPTYIVVRWSASG
ncbi:hypothetical protein AB205_0063760 [Aquarana catesbeiana]|uniref:CTLH domain-containing protein n=1 Tax=Aquarana catesbeiana TaxID=8400 RepID=A0A2G9RNS3_AQUCT|nr:hypothetical protein AB205_0063760 [Aquarana catesbeiana]